MNAHSPARDRRAAAGPPEPQAAGVTAAELERLAREHWPRLVAFAQRRCRSRDDAEDAAQEALVIAFRVRDRIRPQTAVGYLCVIALHEAIRLQRHAGRLRSLDQPIPDTGGLCPVDLIVDPRQPDREAVIDIVDWLRDAKPDHARALCARTLGWRYLEICEVFGWTYTKTNRCVTEGRAQARRRIGGAGESAEATAAHRPA
jgi:DNA-directed RNA polymerase specialized sigma24 family protein